MINLQSSKKLIKTYDELLTNSYPYKYTHHSLMPSERVLLNAYQSTVSGKPLDHSPSQEYSKKPSKMINIEFHENYKLRQKDEIRLKRKMMTSTEKFYNRKKNNYSTYVKETYQKAGEEKKHNQTFLTIGSHAIKKMDYTASIFTKDYKFLEENHINIKLRLKNQFNFADIQPVAGVQESKKVLILKKRENKKDELLVIAKPSTQRRSPHPKPDKRLERVSSQNPVNNNTQIFQIEQYIPVRRSSIKRQPFIFGLGQKQQNPEKNRDKLLLYHDFLWKINYSNGLYIKPSDDQVVYRAYIGPGNNSNLIRSILKRRFWWTIVDKFDNCNFSWTQLKVNSIFKDHQTGSKTKMDKIYSKHLEVEENLKSEPIASLQEGHQRIFNSNDLINWNRHMRKFRRTEGLINEKTYKNRLQFLSCKDINRIECSQKILMHNHLEQNFYIGNKKALFYNMKKFYQLQNLDVFDALPLTFHITKGIDDPQFKVFLDSFTDFENKKKKGEDVKNVWIMKPGENSNRGNGITVCHGLEDIKIRLKAKEKNSDGNLRTFIIQKYMEKPLLYKGRKFDIRHYMLLTCFNGIIKAYWFPEGYIRTSSSLFSLKRGTNLYIHLTNDAIQKNSEQYGKYEKGNKISYEKFQNYLDKNSTKKQNNVFYNSILPGMKQLALQAVKSTYLTLDPSRKEHNFELLGMDFMIDQDFKPWLIEINTNPCLQLSSPLLSRIIPSLIEQTFRICVDPFFPPPEQWPSNKKMFINDSLVEENQLELIFDESVDGQKLLSLYGNNLALDSNMGKIEEDDQVYENDGVEEWQQKH